MFKKILVANRGEIALRVIRACKELGIKTVIVYSYEDRESIPVKISDEKICIGQSSSEKSYLNIVAIAESIIQTEADAVHPGYGFLSENPSFAGVCRDLNVTFIGPPMQVIKQLSNKLEVKKQLKKAGISTIIGSDSIIQSTDEAEKIAKKIGYPVLLKAVWGGGGRGLRIIRKREELKNAFLSACEEAKISFGKADIYMEKFIEHPKHVEVQILVDKFGNIIHLYERDCTLQRRHQKFLEESPSPFLSPQNREKILNIAIKIARILNYENVGTVEFLLDEQENFYFIEVNTRIQVEHPVTEMCTGIDIVKEQIKLASGEKLSINQEDVNVKFHSMECRINAEDERFVPSPGKIEKLFIPGGPGVRVDSAIYGGYTVSSYYDSLLAKLIVRGNTRKEMIGRMERALDEFIVEGIKTNIPFLEKLITNNRFKNKNYDTNYIDRTFLK
ncbi:MAG: acetyl-CoA carboxylase biotin carboxylase subunit [Deltaproteobacteria bacterium]|nr:acetyl-CoA carboxylase biotin carboxylase subunit [Deltaproteobacteria bacterium]